MRTAVPVRGVERQEKADYTHTTEDAIGESHCRVDMATGNA